MRSAALALLCACALLLPGPMSIALGEGAGSPVAAAAAAGGGSRSGGSRALPLEIEFNVSNADGPARSDDLAWVELAAPPGELMDPGRIALFSRDSGLELVYGILPEDVERFPDGSVHRVRMHFMDTFASGETRAYRAVLGQSPSFSLSPMYDVTQGEFFVLQDSTSNTEWQVHIDDSVFGQYTGVYYIHILNSPRREVRAHGSILVRVGGNQLDPDQASFQMYWGPHTGIDVQRSPLMTRLRLSYDQPQIVHWGPGGATIQQIVRDVDFISANLELDFVRGVPMVDIHSKRVINERFWNHNGFVMEFSALVGSTAEWDGELEVVYGTELGRVHTPTTQAPTWTSACMTWQGIDVGEDAAPVYGDLDGDGDLDAMVGGSPGGLVVLENVGTAQAPALARNATWEQGLPDYDRARPTLGDVDADGDLDLIVGWAAGQLRVFRNDGGPSVPSWTSWMGFFDRLDLGDGTTPWLADMDSDGDLDLMSGLGDGTLHVWINTGTPASPRWGGDDVWVAHLNSGPTRSPAERWSSPSLADVDADGDLDLLIGSNDGKVTYFENVGDEYVPRWAYLDVALFAGPWSGTWVAANSTPVMADIDADGDLDLFIGDQDGYVRFFRNDGLTTPYKGHHNLQPLLNGTYRLMRDKDGNDGPFVVEGFADEWWGWYALANPRTGDALLRYIPDFDRLAYKQEYWGDLYPYSGGNVSFYPYDTAAREYVTRAMITSNTMTRGISGGTFISQTGTSSGFVMQPMTAMTYDSREVMWLVPRQTSAAAYDALVERFRHPLETITPVDLFIDAVVLNPTYPWDGCLAYIYLPREPGVNVGTGYQDRDFTVVVNASYETGQGRANITISYWNYAWGSPSVWPNVLWDTWGYSALPGLRLEITIDTDGNITELDEHNNVFTMDVEVAAQKLPWSPPEVATTSPATSHQVDLVVRRDGTLYAAWETVQGEEEIDIEGASYDPSTRRWSSVETLATDSHYAVSPALALYGNEVHLVYASNIEELSDYYRTRSAVYYWSEKFDIWTRAWDGSWGQAERLTFAEDFNDSDQAPDIVFGANALRTYFRNTHFDFYQGGNQMNNIPFQECDVRTAAHGATGWDTGNTTLATTAGSQAWWGGPQAAPEGGNLVWVVYETEVANAQWDVVAEARNSAGLLRTVALTSTGGADEVRPAIASSASGTARVLVAYETTRNGNRDIAVRWRSAEADPSAGWSAETVLAAHPASDMKPTVASDNHGNYWVAWETTRHGNKDIVMMTFDGTEWTGPFLVTDEPNLYDTRVGSDEQPCIAVDEATGRVFVAWESDRDGHGDKNIYMRTYLAHRPTISLASVEPQPVDEDSEVTVNITAVDLDKDFHRIEWDWGDGNTSRVMGSIGTHTYTTAGTYRVTAVGHDLSGLSTDPLSFDVVVRNVAPVAFLTGNETVVEDAEATFDATGSHDTPSDDGTLTITWDLGDGTTKGPLPLGEGTTMAHVFTAAGQYTVTAVVSDQDGAKGYALLNVTVVNIPPTVTAYARQEELDEDEEGEFGGRADDTPSDAGRGHTFQWVWGDGTFSATASDPVAVHAYAAAGTYTATLHAFDDDLGEGTASVTVTIGNIAPTVVRIDAPPNAVEDAPVEFTAVGADTPSDETLLDYMFTWGDGTSTPWSSAATASHAFPASGTYDVTVSVRDDDGALAEATHTLVVMNTAPVARAEANPAQAPEGATVWLSAANSTDTPSDMESLRYVWDAGEGDVVEGRIVNVTFRTAGLRVVELTVIDDDGESSRVTVEVLVINRPPVAVGNVSVGTLRVGQVVELSAAGSTDDPWDVAGLTYSWLMGDGTTLTGPTASYIYSMPGTYTVTLKVRDADGGEGTWTATVTVLAAGGGDGDGGDGSGWALYAAAGAAVAAVVIVALLLYLRGRNRPQKVAAEQPPEEAPPAEVPEAAKEPPPPGEE